MNCGVNAEMSRVVAKSNTAFSSVSKLIEKVVLLAKLARRHVRSLWMRRQSLASAGLLDLRTNRWTFASLCAARPSIMVSPSRLLRLFGMPLICLTCFALSGGHWAVFQTIAWAQMIRDYSRTATIAEAIAKTFNAALHAACAKRSPRSDKRRMACPRSSSSRKRVRFSGWRCGNIPSDRTLRSIVTLI